MKSHLSTNYSTYNDVKPEAYDRSHGIYSTAEKIPGKPRLEDRLMKAVQTVTY